MKKKITYQDEPMKVGQQITDFLPSPEELVLRQKTTKITLALTDSTLRYFKINAKRYGTQYQKLIRQLLDDYVSKIEKNPV